jgi:hypothetical protein
MSRSDMTFLWLLLALVVTLVVLSSPRCRGILRTIAQQLLGIELNDLLG